MAVLLYAAATILLGLQAFGITFARISTGWLGLTIFVFTYALLGHLN